MELKMNKILFLMIPLPFPFLLYVKKWGTCTGNNWRLYWTLL